MQDSKKLAPVYLLRVLRAHSSADAPLTQKRIGELLASEYGLELERKAVARNLQLLADALPAEVAAAPGGARELPDGTVQQLTGGWYSCAEPLFDESELRYLADGILTSKSLKPRHRRDLIRRLAGLACGEACRELEGLAEVAAADANRASNPQLFYNVMLLSEAIRDRRRVSFTMGGYDLKGKIRKRSHDDKGGGKSRVYVVEPKGLMMSGDRYYLVATYPRSERVYHFRVDMIFGLELRDSEKDDEQREREREAGEPRQGDGTPAPAFDPMRYRDQHALMFSGEVVEATIALDDTALALRLLFDSFGRAARIVRHSEDGMLVAKVRSARENIRLWGEQHADVAEVVEPADLRDELRDYAQHMAWRYVQADDDKGSI